MPNTNAAPAAKAFFPIVLSIGFAAFMSKLDTYIVNISLPTISQDFNISTSQVSLIVLCYMIALTSTLLIFGKLAERFGLKRMFIAGYLLFTVSSLLCGLAPNILALIAARTLQGIGGAMLTISIYALVPKLLPPEITGWAFGWVTMGLALGVTIGSPLGGIITGYLSWHWIFLINVPVGIIAVIFAQHVLPGDTPDAAAAKPRPSFDSLGAVLSFLAIIAWFFALNQGEEYGWGSLQVILSLAAGIVLTVMFIGNELHHENPLLDLKVFKVPAFSFALASVCLMLIFMAGNSFLMPFYLELIKGLQPQQTGLIMMLFSLSYLFVAPMAGKLADRINPVWLCIPALFACLSGSGFFYLHLAAPGCAAVIIWLTWFGLSYGFFLAPNMKLMLGFVPEAERGPASGVYSIFNNLSLAVGVCLFETLFSAFSPHGTTSLAHAKMSLPDLLAGFKISYLFTIGLFLLALVITLNSVRAGRR